MRNIQEYLTESVTQQASFNLKDFVKETKEITIKRNKIADKYKEVMSYLDDKSTDSDETFKYIEIGNSRIFKDGKEEYKICIVVMVDLERVLDDNMRYNDCIKLINKEFENIPGLKMVESSNVSSRDQSAIEYIYTVQ